jgi:hypothetical protein
MNALARFGQVALAAALTAALAVAWWFAPEPQQPLENGPMAQSVSVEPKPLKLVCPGAAVRVGGEAGTEVGLIERLGLAQASVRNSDAGASVAFEADFTEFQTLSSNSQLDQSSDLLSAWQWQELSAPRIVGAAAAACQSPVREQWFVAGSTQSQADSVLLVHNPGAVESAVSVSAFGAAAAELDFALAPGATELISLATLAPSSEELAVRVVSSAPIASWLQHRTSRGLGATGFDLAAGQLPNSSIAIAGLSVLGSDLAPLAELTTPVLRVFNPGAEPVEVLARVISSDGRFGTAERLVLNPNSFQSVSLGDLAEGDYAIFIDANQPILAGAFNPVALSLNSFDFAWLAASELFSNPFALAAGKNKATLAIANPSEQVVRVNVELGNRQLQLRLAAGSQQVIEVPANTEVRVLPEGAAVAATLRISAEGYSVVQPRESQNLASESLVSVR